VDDGGLRPADDTDLLGPLRQACFLDGVLIRVKPVTRQSGPNVLPHSKDDELTMIFSFSFFSFLISSAALDSFFGFLIGLEASPSVSSKTTTTTSSPVGTAFSLPLADCHQELRYQHMRCKTDDGAERKTRILTLEGGPLSTSALLAGLRLAQSLSDASLA
jgi:hypothetical protein